MLFSSRFLVLTICIYSSLAATVMKPVNVPADPAQPTVSDQSEVEFISNVHKEMPPPVDSELTLKKHTTDSLKTVEDTNEGPEGKKHTVTTTAMEKTQEKKQTEQHSDNELGHLVTTHFDGHNQGAYIGGREVTGHSPTSDTVSHGVLNGQMDTSIKGENRVQQLRNGQVKTGNITSEKADYQHFASNDVRSHHPDEDHNIQFASQTDNVKANSNTGHRTTIEQTLKQPYSSIQLADVFSDEDKVHSETQFSHKQVATDTPTALLKIDKTARKINVNKTKDKREKLLIKQSTPLSNLFVLDMDGEQNNTEFEREIVNINTTADNKKGTLKTKSETIQKQVKAQTAKHSNSFTLTKTPGKGSSALPLTVQFQTMGIDSEHKQETKQDSKVINTVTPFGAKNEKYNERTSTEFHFNTKPSKQNEKTTEKESQSDIVKASEDPVSGNDEKVAPPNEVLSKSNLNKSPKQAQEVEKSDKQEEEKVEPSIDSEQEHSTSSESTEELQSDSVSKPDTTAPQQSSPEHANTEQDITTENNHQDHDDDQHNDSENETENDVTAADADEYYGTMILLVPGNKVEGEDPLITFKKRGITKENLKLVKFAKENRLASNIVIAGLVNKEKITVEKIDDFLYNFSENDPIGVVNILPFTNEGQVYALKKKE